MNHAPESTIASLAVGGGSFKLNGKVKGVRLPAKPPFTA